MMKKIISTLLIATLLLVPVICASVSAEEDTGSTTPVLVNLLPSEGAETDNYKLICNADGSVTVELKVAASADAPVVVDLTYADATFSMEGDAPAVYAVADYETTGSAKLDKSNSADSNGTRFVYTRRDPVAEANLFLGSMLDTGNYQSYIPVIGGATDGTTGYAVWDLAGYISSSPTNLTATKIHNINAVKISLADGAVGDTVTFYALALTNTAEGLNLGTKTPLVAPVGDDTTTDDTTTDDTTTDDTTTDDTTTDDTTTDDTTTDDTTTDDTTTDDTTTDDTTTDDDTTTEETSADVTASVDSTEDTSAPTTGDAGIIVFAVLGVLAVIGAAVLVRTRR